MTSPRAALFEDDERSLAKYEDIRVTANRSLWTVHLQARRLAQLIDEQLPEFVLKCISDAEFLVVSLHRLLMSAKAIDQLEPGLLSTAIADFERATPNLVAARNVIAHLDEYLLGTGHNRTVAHAQLMTSSLGADSLTFAGFEFDLKVVVAAADALFSSIRTCPPAFYEVAVRRSAENG